jgi:hypothetical protein
MKDFLTYLKSQLFVDSKLILVYVIVYFLWGMIMNYIGIKTEIARFSNWWQVITVYLIYMIPISLLLRGLPFAQQYAFGLVAMGLLEFSGYALGTSYAYPHNILDRLFNIRNFSLAMALFFAFYFPLGNWAANRIFKGMFVKSSN